MTQKTRKKNKRSIGLDFWTKFLSVISRHRMMMILINGKRFISMLCAHYKLD